MTTLDTLSALPARTHDAHEHSWSTESRHPTSEGYVLYVRCATCGRRRVDLQSRRDAPPTPLSRTVGGRAAMRR